MADTSTVSGSGSGSGPAPFSVLLQVLRHLREAIMLTTSELDPPGPQIIYVNPAFTAMTGYERRELIGRSPRLLQGELTDRETLDRLRRNLERGETFEGEAVNYRKDGTPFLLRWYVEPLCDAAGRMTHYVAVLRDVTEERDADRLNRMMRSAMEQSSDLVLIFDHRGRVSYANPAYQRWSGWSRQRIGETPVWRLPGRPAHREEVRWARSLLSQGRPWQRDYEVRRLDGPSGRRDEQCFLFVTISPIHRVGGAVTHFVAMGRDVTERHRLESIAVAHNFHDSLGLVFSGIRHELGNPVNSVKTALRVVRDGLPDMPRDKLASYLERIGTEVERVEYLLGSLRSYNMFQRPELQCLDAAEFLHRFARLAGDDLAQLGITFELVLDGGVDTMYGDPRGLHQVLLNLLNNATEAVGDQPEPRIELRARRRGPRLELRLRDNGRGIPADRLQDVFKPFYTSRSGGTGLGLAITRRLVSQMRGTVELNSSPRGTDVTVVLDRHAPPSAPEGG